MRASSGGRFRYQQPQSDRTDVNSPLQGSAAVLIKLAMVRIDAALEQGGHRAAMLHQGNDELVFDSLPEVVDSV